ncbi:MAG: hypothetical protein ACLQKK_06850 [Rhodomicrobium sp.]
MFRKMAATLIVAFATLSTARAEDAAKLALSIPAEVTEVATAGSWADGDASGVFRAIVLTAPAGEATQAHLVLQLLTLGTDGSPNKVYKTVTVKKIDDKKLPNAFLAVEEDGTENEVTWRVTTYDSNSNADISALVTIDSKGEATVKDAPKEEDTAAQQGADKKN